MATETFDKTIWIDEKSAEILANELEKPRQPYITGLNTEEVNRSAQKWLERFVSKTSSMQEENKNF